MGDALIIWIPKDFRKRASVMKGKQVAVSIIDDDTTEFEGMMSKLDEFRQQLDNADQTQQMQVLEHMVKYMEGRTDAERNNLVKGMDQNHALTLRMATLFIEAVINAEERIGTFGKWVNKLEKRLADLEDEINAMSK